MTHLNFFATTPKGLELLLVDELRALGAKTAAEKLAGVVFTGDLSLAYQACLWSRLANRILLSLQQVPAKTPQELYAGIQTISWGDHIHPDKTLAVHCVCSQSDITHSLFAAQKIKDAIVDQLREQFGVRPNVSRERPDISIYVYLHRNIASIYLDLSGESLHKRGYRLASGAAPLKENLAAAILLRAGWPKLAKEGASLLDPMCGSGTLLIEAAMMAGDIAPGLERDYFGFVGWNQHQPALFEKALTEAKVRRLQGIKTLPSMVGYDHDASAIKMAFENIERAHMQGHIHVEKRDLSLFVPKPNTQPGLVVVNPPYGERLGDMEALKPLYTLLGDRLKQAFTGWKAAVFTGNPELGKQMGLRAKHYYSLFNGALACQLLLFDVEQNYFVDRSPEAANIKRIAQAKQAMSGKDQQAIQMFVNRLTKNLKHLKRQAQKEGRVAYRVYDADLPEYAFAIDLTPDAAHVQEYEAPKKIDEQKVLQRRQEVLAVLPNVLGFNAAQIYYSVLPRKRKKD